MSFGADLNACAALVEKGDPDRFAAAMAGPVDARRLLFPLYAFNVEVSRAPWLTQEPMIAEMRLQWWRDALEEIAETRSVRRHEVVTPLSEVLDPRGAGDLDATVAVRRWDIYKDAFEDKTHFDDYLMQTAGTLMWTAARLSGAPAQAESEIRALGRATGLARYLQAVPALESQGRIPLLDGRNEAVADLAQAEVAKARAALKSLRDLPQSARPALTEAFQTVALLKRVVKTPACVADGTLRLNPAHRSVLLWTGARG